MFISAIKDYTHVKTYQVTQFAHLTESRNYVGL